MYIVPIATRARGSDIQQIWLLLERNGTHLMSVDTIGNSPVSSAEQFADANGLVLSSEPFESHGLIFLPVDCDKTDMSSFYSWREVLPGTVPSKEVWRQFVWASDSLDVNLLLNSILIGDPEYSVYSVLNAYLKANR
jgi:hypothetical protein